MSIVGHVCFIIELVNIGLNVKRTCIGVANFIVFDNS